MKKIVVVFLMLVGVGCASPQVYNYAPSSTMSLSGNLNVGEFRYLPSEKDPKLKPNRLPQYANFLGNIGGGILVDRPLHEYYEAAVKTESRLVGINLGDSQNVFSGEILDMHVYNNFNSADWVLEVRYLVSNTGKEPCYDQTYRIERRLALAQPLQSLNGLVKESIEKVFGDDNFVSCIKS